MILWVVSYLSGSFIALYFHGHLGWSFIGVFLALFFVLFCKTHRIAPMISICLVLLTAAYALTSWAILQKNAWSLPPAWIKKPIEIQGRITSIPRRLKIETRFNFQTNQWQQQKRSVTLHLSWYHNPPKLRLGQYLKLIVKLKPLHFYQNPQSFAPYWRRLMVHYQASGYVLSAVPISKKPAQLLKQSIDHWRQTLVLHIQKAVKNSSLAGIIVALTVGSRVGLTPDIWRVFQLTGTSHLVAISGLHVGLIATVMYWLMGRIWRLSACLCQWMPAPRVAALSAMLIALVYGALAGFSLPTQRAVIMICLFMLTELLGWSLLVSYRLMLTFMIVLMRHPLALISASFWLSFSAVAWMSYGLAGGLIQMPRWRLWWRVQYGVTLGLLPLTFLYFHQISLVAIGCNLFAIPWVSLLIVPLCFLSGLVSFLSERVSAWLFQVTAALLTPLWNGLHWIAGYPWVYWLHFVPSITAFILMFIGIFWILAPFGIPHRYLGIMCCLPAIITASEPIHFGDFRLVALDVGQGLAVVLETAHHVLIYDTGPRYPSGFDAGRDILLPYLTWRGVDHVNMLMISHGDNDHIGGAFSLLQSMKVDHIITSVPGRFRSPQAHYCYAGLHWSWDGVIFTVLYPPKNQPYVGNNSSCVLKVSNGLHTALLTGDIEQSAEHWLVLHDSQRLKAQWLLAPHHGSKTSSSWPFLEAVQPRWVIFSTGFYNRFHFPRQSVINRYHALGATLYNTATQGAVTALFHQQDSTPSFIKAQSSETMHIMKSLK